ncbi:hypothetical protein CP8484711_0724A, partial [Chlamydia psittaci 84-8471/1]
MGNVDLANVFLKICVVQILAEARGALGETRFNIKDSIPILHKCREEKASLIEKI